MAGNLIEQMNILKGLSDEALNYEMSAPSGAAPPYLVLTEVQRRKDMRSRYEGEAARAKRRTTVMEDLVVPMGGQMRPVGGIAAASSSTPRMAGLDGAVPGYADGGIVGLDALVKQYNDRLADIPSQRDRARAMALISAGAGIMGSKHSNTLRNIGIGAGQGVTTYNDALALADRNEESALQGLLSLHNAQLQNQRMAQASYSQTPVFLKDDKGQMHAGQMSSDGGVLIDGIKQAGIPAGWTVVARPENMDTVNLGDQQAVFDPNTGTWVAGPTIQGTPGTNMNVSGTGPSREMLPAPGSKESLEREEAAAKKTLVEEQAAQTAGIVSDDINRAIAAIEANPMFTTGLGAVLTQGFGFGPAADVGKLIDTVKANVSFDKLQQMRASSPTGAALGPVSDFENRLLQATIGNLEQSQNKEQLLYNLERVLDIYTKIITVGIKDPNAEPAATAPPVSGMVGDVEFTVEP